ncbi:MAG: fumarylacetoacetate hydrolase family protein [Anaeromusa sp.]|uniref:fumarylacetoacetate hydrolase family protein n=1 Tax=Anaeromusa sp. TaxID=1872520 RepID=UPI002B211C7B|nr:fumarylacetoacetate hydrolase family protein [Anaeromusa sp.]MEA4835299.1 fumarylacetoacetate hydrolase family protein [Anaeromusa sp.]
MKLVSFYQNGQPTLGIQQENGIIPAAKAAATASLTVPRTMEEAIFGGQNALFQLQALVETKPAALDLETVTYAPCVAAPEKILCVGLNYAAHSAECKADLPTVPVIFSKFNNTLAAHQEEIPIPPCTSKVDYEAELVIIIGKTASNVSKENALDYVFGYTAGNDLSARDLQMRTPQWLLGKTCDHFAPTGPCVVTADSLNPAKLEISSRVNGEIRQHSNTSDMIFDCATVISYLSQHLTLKPGDLIFTGTPSGVILGYPEENQVWLKGGDEVVIEIEGIGRLVNKLSE